jgi:hypothetical protein
MLHKDKNIGLMTTRLTKDDWSILATDHIITHKAVSRYDISYLFPLYLYNATENQKPNNNQPKLSDPGWVVEKPTLS